MAEHFIGMERLLEVVRLTKVMDDPLEIIAELESEDVHKEKKADPKRAEQKKKAPAPSHHGHKRK
jgi:helicase